MDEDDSDGLQSVYSGADFIVAWILLISYLAIVLSLRIHSRTIGYDTQTNKYLFLVDKFTRKVTIFSTEMSRG